MKIWMNNPLRFAGETFYQSSYFVDRGREGTVLQVVTNTGLDDSLRGLHVGGDRLAGPLFDRRWCVS